MFFMWIQTIIIWVISLFALLNDPNKITAVVSVVTAVLVMFTSILVSYTQWQKDRGRLQTLEDENVKREKEIEKSEKVMKEALDKHVDESKHDLELIYQKIDKSNDRLSAEISKLNHFLMNLNITLKGQKGGLKDYDENTALTQTKKN